MCSECSVVGQSGACSLPGLCVGPIPHWSSRGWGVCFFTTVGARHKLRWRKAQVPLALLLHGVGTTMHVKWRDTPRYLAV